MRRRPYRVIVAGACAAGAAAVALALGGPVGGDGWLLELSIAARARVAPGTSAPSPVAVIAVDRRSLDAPEFVDEPRARMAPRLVPVVDALVAAGARAVGFDIVFAYRGDRLRPGHDDPFLEMLARHRARLVLARSEDMLPDRAFIAALGALGPRADPDAIALTTVTPDADGVFRRVPAAPVVTPIPARAGADPAPPAVPGLAAALLRRAGAPPMPPEVLLAPRRAVEEIPTYALVDVLRCASGAPDALRHAFAGRVVLVGGTLPEEDRKLVAGRLLEPPSLAGPPLHGCGLRPLAASAAGSGDVPGVYIHAAAVEAVLTGRVTRTAPPPVTAVLAGLTAGAGAAFGLLTSPWIAMVGTAGLGLLVFGSATLALARDLWVPVAVPLGALLAAPGVAYVVRYLVEERTRRRVQLAFAHYLSPQVVDRLVDEPSALQLGGERRDVTVMFADLSGFTALSGVLPPEALTALTNRYLGYIVDQVEATGGYVDKFIGDAVMAIWGAPVPDARHARHAVRAALAAAGRIRAEAAAASARGERSFSVKIGLNSGLAVVGNVGTERRYNYTAVGETVNVAARLEGVPALYGCAVVVGPATAEAAAADFLLRELDLIQVKGREAPLAIWEPVVPVAEATAEHRDRVRRYAEALALYRARRFADAAAQWDVLAKDEGAVDGPGDAPPVSPPARMAEWARACAAEPPPPSWTGVRVLAGK